MSHLVLINHILGGLAGIPKRSLAMSFSRFSLNSVLVIFGHRITRLALEHVELPVDHLVQLVLLLLDLHLILAFDSLTQMIVFRSIMMCSFLINLYGTYRIDRVYPRRAKSGCSSSTNASIVQTFHSRFILIVFPVFLLRMCEVSMPVRLSWSKITRW